MTAAILTEGLTKRFGRDLALDDLDLRVEAGEVPRPAFVLWPEGLTQAQIPRIGPKKAANGTSSRMPMACPSSCESVRPTSATIVALSVSWT